MLLSRRNLIVAGGLAVSAQAASPAHAYPIVEPPIVGDRYLGQGTVMTRSVSQMPLADDSLRIARYMPKMPMEYVGAAGKPWRITNLNQTEYNIPVYYVDSTDPKQTFVRFDSVDSRVVRSPALYQATTGMVPFPSYAVPAGPANGDRSLAVWDVGTGIIRSYFYVRADADGVRWFASATYSIADPGFHRIGEMNYWIRGVAGTNSVAGMHNELGQIGINEALRGRIAHALSFTIANARPVTSWPARSNDGNSTNPAAPAQGQWFRLPPGLNLSAMNLRPFTKIVAAAVQQYGGFAADKNLWCHAFNAEHPIHWTRRGLRDPWAIGGAVREKYGKIDCNDFPWHLTQWAPVDWGKPPGL